MKKYLPFVLLLAVVACISQMEDSSSSSSIVGLPERSHLFTFDSTAMLVSNIMQHPTLSKVVQKYALGATFPASQLKLEPNSVGIAFWYCFRAGKNPEFFLAAEQLTKFDIRNLPTRPFASTLLIPEFSFKGEPEINNVDEVKHLLTNQLTPSTGVKSISRALVDKYVMSFDSLMTVLADEKGEKYNQYPFCFFARNKAKDLELFLTQAGDNGFVKYYFGYDESEQKNRIRVILISGNGGRNNVMAREKDEPIILQKSVPPPPVE